MSYEYFEGNDVHENCKNCREAYDKLFKENEQLLHDLDTANACVTALDARADKAEDEVGLWQKKYKISDDIRHTFEQQNAELVAEVKRLRTEVKHCYDRIPVVSVEMDALRHENEQLRQALLRCSPYSVWDVCGFECYSCNAFHTDDHKPNCEYIRLTRTKLP